MVKTRLERHIFLCMFNIKYEKFLKVKRFILRYSFTIVS